MPNPCSDKHQTKHVLAFYMEEVYLIIDIFMLSLTAE